MLGSLFLLRQGNFYSQWYPGLLWRAKVCSVTMWHIPCVTTTTTTTTTTTATATTSTTTLTHTATTTAPAATTTTTICEF